MSLRRTATNGVFWTSFQQFGSQIINFGISLILARMLLPREFGLLGMISVFISIGNSLINSGLASSLIRSKKTDQEDYSTVFFFNLIGSLIVYFLVYISAPYIAIFYDQDILVNIIRVYCVSFIINAFSVVQITRLTKIMDFRTQMLVQIPSIIISGILGIYLAYQNYGVWSLVWMSLCQNLISTLQFWIRSKWTPSFVFNKTKFKYHFNYGYKLTLSGLLDTVFTNIYQIIIGRYFAPAHVGYYTRASTLRQLPVANLSAILNKVTYPLFASINDDDMRLKRVYKEIMQLVLFIISPTLVLMGVLAEPLFRFLFTEKWLPAVPYFQILCIAGVLYPIHAYNLNILQVKGRSDLFLKLEIIKKINIIIIIAVSINFGIKGLIWGQLINSIIALFINTHYSGKFINYKMWEQFLDILPILGLSAFMGVYLWLIDEFSFIGNLLDFYRLSILLINGIAIYTGLAFILKMPPLISVKKILLKK